MIKLIVAHDKNMLIGNGNVMPWHIKEELQFFRKETLNQNLLMGRTTFEGIGKVLTNRTTYVLTSNKSYQVADENVVVINDVKELFDKFKNSEDILFIAGGKKIYEQFYLYADELIISTIEDEFVGDTYLTNIDLTKYKQYNEQNCNKFTIRRYSKYFV
ncbi:dihydrofolate reductase [Bacilli bacterium PM5-3]|nr:dihydrofolate reductase [Bacilli bacterium PM5-3]MDH6603652.1 dihydrofolate reductase [Bacilli bacterium PM5-9]